MHIFSTLELEHNLIIYLQIVWGGKKSHLFGAIVSFVIVIFGFFLLVNSTKENIWGDWGMILFFFIGLLIFLIQLMWGPFLMVSEQGIYVRPNPFLPQINLQWNEIASITSFEEKGKFYFDVALSPTDVEAFLQRQSPFNRKILSHRLNRIHQIARFPQRLLPCSLGMLLEAIQEQYDVPIQKYHISIKIHSL